MVLSIQYLRGIAALLVVLSHVAWKGRQYSTDPLDFFRIGESGVDIFFVISGFIMCYTTAKSSGTPAASLVFLKNRVRRIIPLYWVLTALVLPVFLLFPGKVNSGGGTTEVLNSFLLIPTDNKYLIQAGWTLSYEFFFYFIFSIGMLTGKMLGQALTVYCLGILFYLGIWLRPTSVWGQFLTDPMLVEFAFGILLYNLKIGGMLSRRIGAICIAASTALLLAVNFELLELPYRCFRLGLPAFMLCYGLVSFEDDLLKRPLAPLKTLGDLSYSLYLIHPFPLAILGIFWYRFVGKEWGGLFTALLIAAAVFAGWACYRYLELRLGRIFKPSERRPVHNVLA